MAARSMWSGKLQVNALFGADVSVITGSGSDPDGEGLRAGSGKWPHGGSTAVISARGLTRLERRGRTAKSALAMLVALVMSLGSGVGLAISPPTAAANTPATRSCGDDSKGIGIRVRASQGVTCSLAKHLMEKLLLGSAACYPHGYTARPSCRLDGYKCSAYPTDQGRVSHGRCTERRRLVTGVAGP
jgi:hypothetical protein